MTDGPQFAGMGIEEFTFSFSTLPENQHLYVGFLVDLPGPGGRTHVEGTVRDRTLSLYGEIIDWRPLPTIYFDGSLQAEADLGASSFEFSFDAHAKILGSRTQMSGHLASSPSGFELYAMGVVELTFPNGTKIADFAATIDVNSNSHFDIDLAADFKLPGYRPALVQLGGNIGTSGVGIHADVDDWRLIPGLAFEGTLDVQTDFQARQLSLIVDVHTDLTGFQPRSRRAAPSRVLGSSTWTCTGILISATPKQVCSASRWMPGCKRLPPQANTRSDLAGT